MAETVITEIADVYQSCRLGRYRVGLVVAFCSVSFIICLPLCIKVLLDVLYLYDNLLSR